MKNIFSEKKTLLLSEIKQIDVQTLAIHSYNKQYILNSLLILDYYFDIYISCLKEALKQAALPVKDLTMIDYGGGSGFLSMLAKAVGFKTVIYIDIHENAVQTVQVLKETLQIGPDIILQGDADVLKKYLQEENISPELLIATDLIEHIYDLELFFEDILAINPSLHMLFTTASNPYNPILKRKLRKMMLHCEYEKENNFLSLRKQYIQEKFPETAEEQVIDWAKKTRGLRYQDIKEAIENQKFPTDLDAYNTCNPVDGSWAERILAIKVYRDILLKYEYELRVKKLYYPLQGDGKIKVLLKKTLNMLIFLGGKVGIILSPVILLSCEKANKK